MNCLKLSDTLVLPEDRLDLRPWQLAENYLHIGIGGQKIFKVGKLGRGEKLEQTGKKQPIISTLLKILTYATLVFPIIALIMKAVYRSRYHFEVHDTQKESRKVSKANQALNSAVCEKIEQFRQENFKIGLIIDWDQSQPLPQQEGWKWLELSAEKNESLTHLAIDLTNKNEVKQISQLFDQVIVNPAYFYRWGLLKPLLRDENSSLITKIWSENIGLTIDSEQKQDVVMGQYYKTASEEEKMIKNTLDTLKAQVGDEEFEKEFQQELTNLQSNGETFGAYRLAAKNILKAHALEPTLTQEEYQEFTDLIKTHLTTQFGRVEFHHQENYPFFEHVTKDYWELKGAL